MNDDRVDDDPIEPDRHFDIRICLPFKIIRAPGYLEITCDWISVKDRLPEEKGKFPSNTVLIACSDGEVALGYAHKGRMDYQCGECFRGESITHWMPLPEAPKD